MRVLVLLLLMGGSSSAAWADRWTVVTDDGHRVDLESERLKSVAYVQAGRGDGVASRFGHSLLRFTFCPDSTECEEAQTDSFDFGFAAETPNGYFSALGGVIGRYPSALIVVPSLKTERRYLFAELRDILVAPLRLSESERKVLLKGAATEFWQQLNPYKFLTNNCAVQLLHLFQAVWGDRAFGPVSNSMLTPSDLLHLLIKAGRVQERDLDHQSSSRATYEGFVHDFMLARNWMLADNLKRYSKSPARLRRLWMQEFPNSSAQIWQWILLEEYTLRQLKALYARSALRNLMNHDQGKCEPLRDPLLASFEAATVTHLRTATGALLSEDRIFALRHNYALSLEKALNCMRGEKPLKRLSDEIEFTIQNLKMLRAG